MTADSKPLPGRKIIASGAILALLAVGAGAFAAHGLRDSLDAYRLGIFETAARYQMYHALALFGIGTLAAATPLPRRWLNVAALAFGAGILLFSGSLYALALGAPRWLGAITPLGGTLFMIGWLAVAVAALKARRGAHG